jgi:predicted lipoprotein
MKKMLGLVVILGLLIFAAMVAAKPAPPAMARCERIHEAVHALDVAMEDMEHAGHDFCGHKEEAMEATRRAHHQLEEAERCDRCRGDRDHDDRR